MAFGVWTASEEVIDGAALTRALVTASGADCRLGEKVVGFERRGDRVVGLRLAGGSVLAADQVIVAAGPDAAALLRPMGLNVPIEPIKGYSLTLPLREAARAPQVSITDAARKMVFARLGPVLRVAGFAELVGHDRALVPARLAALREATNRLFPGACDLDAAVPWAGLRPATPDGSPRIGATRWRGLWLNVGHGALGLTLAAGSAARLVAMMRADDVG